MKGAGVSGHCSMDLRRGSMRKWTQQIEITAIRAEHYLSFIHFSYSYLYAESLNTWSDCFHHLCVHKALLMNKQICSHVSGTVWMGYWCSHKMLMIWWDADAPWGLSLACCILASKCRIQTSHHALAFRKRIPHIYPWKQPQLSSRKTERSFQVTPGSASSNYPKTYKLRNENLSLVSSEIQVL